jgi:hypothetical protein
VRDARRVERHLLDALGDLHRALERRRIGQLNVDDQPAFVLYRDEARRNLSEAEACERNDSEVSDHYDRTQADRPANRTPINVRYRLKNRVETAKYLAECPVYRLNDYPANDAAANCSRSEQHHVSKIRLNHTD